MSDEPFDDLDRALASGIAGLAPALPDADEALATLRPRFRRARTRARAVRVAGVALLLAALGSAALIASPGAARSRVHVEGASTIPDSSVPRHPTPSRPTTTTRPPTTTSTVPIGGNVSPTTTRPHGGTGSAPSTVPVTSPATVPGSGHGGFPGGSGGGGNGNGHGHGATTTTIAAPAGTTTYGSPGGSITVRFSHGSLTLVSVHPAHGYQTEVKDAGPGTHLEVRFRHDGSDWRIELQVANGRVVRIQHGN